MVKLHANPRFPSRGFAGQLLLATSFLTSGGADLSLQTSHVSSPSTQLESPEADIVEAGEDDDFEDDSDTYPGGVEGGQHCDCDGYPRRLGSKWYKYSWEVDYLKAVATAAMLSVTIVFEHIFHKFHHWAGHSFQCGQTMMSEAEKKAAHQRRVFGKPLFLVFVDRMGSEFMVLGFLAFTIWCSNKLKLFDLVSKLDTGALNLPKTGPDYLHLMEDVHMQLFLGMVIYFALVFRIVQGSNKCIADFEWSRQTWIDQIVKGTVPATPQEDHPAVRSFKCWRNHFLMGKQSAVAEILVWREKYPEAFDKLLKSLEISTDNLQNLTLERLQTAFTDRFSFCTYLSFSVSNCVIELVQLNSSTLYTIIVLKLALSLIFRYGKVAYDDFSAFLIIPALLTIMFIHFLTMKFKKALEVDGGTEALVLPPLVAFAHRMSKLGNAEAFVLKVLELNMFFLCNTAAGNLIDKYFWKDVGKGKPNAIIILASHLLTFVCMTWSLPRCIPSFGAVMALPPLFSHEDEKMIQVVSCQVVDSKMIAARAAAQAKKVEKQAQRFLSVRFHPKGAQQPSTEQPLLEADAQLMGKADEDEIALLEDDGEMLRAGDAKEERPTSRSEKPPSADDAIASPATGNAAESTGGTGSTGNAEKLTNVKPAAKKKKLAAKSTAKGNKKNEGLVGDADAD